MTPGRLRERVARCMSAVIFGAAAALAVGCAARSERLSLRSTLFEDRNDEQWWLGGKADLLFSREWYFVGVGTCGPEVSEGQRMDCAMQRALGQAVSMVRQHVKVDIQRRTEFAHQAGDGGFAANVRSTYRNEGSGQSELAVDDVAPRRRTCTSNGFCHALVALDRRLLSARSLRKIAEWQTEVDELLERAEKSDTLSAIEQLAKASRLVASIDREAELLAAVAGPNAVPRSAWDRVSAVRSKRLGSVAVCLSSAITLPPAQLVFSRAHRDLAARGVSRVAIASEPECPDGSISVSFQGSTLERVAEHRLWVHEVRGMVVLRANVGATGKGVPVFGRGVAPLREQARTEAESDLATNVGEALAQLLDSTAASPP